MIDVMREQFEIYAKSKGWEDRHLKQRDDGGYEDWGVHPIWLAWQASRERLVIELPERGLSFKVAGVVSFSLKSEGRNEAIEEIETAIHAVGVKTK